MVYCTCVSFTTTPLHVTCVVGAAAPACSIDIQSAGSTNAHPCVVLGFCYVCHCWWPVVWRCCKDTGRQICLCHGITACLMCATTVTLLTTQNHKLLTAACARVPTNCSSCVDYQFQPQPRSIMATQCSTCSNAAASQDAQEQQHALPTILALLPLCWEGGAITLARQSCHTGTELFGHNTSTPTIHTAPQVINTHPFYHTLTGRCAETCYLVHPHTQPPRLFQNTQQLRLRQPPHAVTQGASG